MIFINNHVTSTKFFQPDAITFLFRDERKKSFWRRQCFSCGTTIAEYTIVQCLELDQTLRYFSHFTIGTQTKTLVKWKLTNLWLQIRVIVINYMHLR